MLGTASTILLWLFVINLVLRWARSVPVFTNTASSCPSGSVLPLNPAGTGMAKLCARMTPDEGSWLRHAVPLTLLTLANLVAAWGASGSLRGWWLAAAPSALADRTFTFSYFIPPMVGLMSVTDSQRSVAVVLQMNDFGGRDNSKKREAQQ